MDLIEQASSSAKQKERDRLLSRIPEHLRETCEYQAAMNWVPPPPDESGTGKSKKKKDKGKSQARVDLEQKEQTWCPNWIPKSCPTSLKVGSWVLVWLTGMLTLAFKERALLLDKELAFPNPFIMNGVSLLCTFLLLGLVVLCNHRCEFVELGHPVDFKGSSCFGIMLAMQLCGDGTALKNSEIYHGSINMAYPITLGLLTVYASKEEKKSILLLLASGLATVGGVLGVSARGTFTLGALTHTYVMQGGLGSLFIGSFRLVIGASFLQASPDGVPRHMANSFLPSPFYLGMTMCVAAGVSSCELTVLLDRGAFAAMLNLPNVGKTVALLCTIFLATTLKLIAELQLLQKTSAVFVGFLTICGGLSYVVASEIVAAPNVAIGLQRMPIVVMIGAAITTIAMALFAAYRILDETEVNPEGYSHLEGGNGDYRNRSSRSRGHRDPRQIYGQGQGYYDPGPFLAADGDFGDFRDRF
jgi:hypothetical protein